MTLCSPYHPLNDPTISREDRPVKRLCEFDGKLYDEREMVFDSLAEIWIHEKNLELYAKREMPEHEQESYIQIIRQENGK